MMGERKTRRMLESSDVKHFPSGAVPPMIRIGLREGPVAGRAQMLAGEGYRVPVSALYTALRWYLEHADARWELGRVEGERRLEAWCSAGRVAANSR